MSLHNQGLRSATHNRTSMSSHRKPSNFRPAPAATTPATPTPTRLGLVQHDGHLPKSPKKGEKSKRRASDIMMPPHLTEQDSMHRMILEIRATNAQTAAIPRSKVAAKLRRAEATHYQAGRKGWRTVRMWYLTPLYIRQAWYDVINAASQGGKLGRAIKLPMERTFGRLPPMSVEDMEHIVQDPRPSTSASERRGSYTLPLSARPPWQRYCKPASL